MGNSHWSEGYVGVPFIPHGRTMKGTDCWGLVRIVLMEQFGTFLPSFDKSYHELTPENNFKAITEAKMELPISPTSDPQEGDIVLMKHLGVSSHVGVYCVIGMTPMVLHSDPIGRGSSRLSRLTDHSIAPRVEGFYRVS